MAEAGDGTTAAPTTGTGTAGTTTITEGQSTAAGAATLLDWRGGLTPELRDDPTVNKYQSQEEAMKALVHSQRLLGRSIQIPQSDEAPAEDWNKVYDKLGRPKTVAEYAVKAPTVKDEATGLDKPVVPDDMQAAILEAAHAQGLNSKQAQAFLDVAGQLQIQQAKLQSGQAAQRQVEGQRALAKEFGATVEIEVGKARNVIAQIGGGRFGGEYAKAAYGELKDAGLFNSPNVVKLLSAIYDATSEGTFHEDSWQAAGGLSLQGLQAELQVLTKAQMDGKATPDEHARARTISQQIAAMSTHGARR